MLAKAAKKGHNRCNSSGVGTASSKLIQYKKAELQRTGMLVSPVTQIVAPGTTKATERLKTSFGCTQKLVFDHQNVDPVRTGYAELQQKRVVAEQHKKYVDYLMEYNNKRTAHPEPPVKPIPTPHAENVFTAQQQKKQIVEPVPEGSSQPTHPPENVINVSGNMDGRIENFIVGKQVGQGAYAAVKVAFHKVLNKKVALKIYDKAKLIEPQRQKSVQREIKIMERLNNPYIAKLYEAFDTPKQVILAMEYVRGTSLHGYLKSKMGRRLPEQEAKRLFKQVVTGIGYCHNKSITHRDIKLENILLDESNNIKIIDFGFSTCIPNTKKIKIFCGTPSYMAPEIVSRKEYAGPPADIWALGVLLYAMLCGAFPFKGENDKDLYRKITRGFFDIPDHLSSLSKALLVRILQVDPDKRPNADKILLDVWLNSTDPVPKPLSSRKKEEHPERSYSHDRLRHEHIIYNEPVSQPRINNNVSPGGTVNNNFHIVNNITHIITYAKDGSNFQSNSPKVKDSIDTDIVNSIIRLGYTSTDVAQQMQNEKSHIFILYSKIKEQREKQQHTGIAPQYVGSLSNSRQNSARSKSKPGVADEREGRISLGSARGKMATQKNLAFNNTGPFVLGEHQMCMSLECSKYTHTSII
eukprot:TRINITY_DN201_c0_g1_i1.p1 TRINITY_DN201_c0_g1~~TRINITY_DN201_c0_g1_i1.p1  ORF type:complete len:638 (-),score=59.80 TRINITY_DN201_c0_g1_i1:11782-13695(-)